MSGERFRDGVPAPPTPPDPPAPPGRRTRKQQQEHTRTCLLRSAATLFTRKGMQQASIDEIAQDAGYTKGAFYANFKNKEELFLAMLDERFAERFEEIDRVVHQDAAIEDQARQAGIDFIRAIRADEQWSRLFFEFAVYASRNEEFRQELVTRHRALRGRIADLFEERARQLDWTPPISAAEAARMTFAMANGVALEQLLEPEADSAELYGTMLTAFFTGLRAASADAPAPR
ncbi:TetR/AcrR family transcriptional regulator [Patulibacter defluvii]|uniref:TetR/AcrR family transcriptional regulator n=1 Tax=Patulibacter defluvii TaxID=3095358 RepID=UPI002A748E60|nr:TetR/AcrR family transcriptional regulator [Patulibacter sp. DM4]